MELGYEGKVVGITGAGSVKGIGFAIARRMLREGAKVFICDLKQEVVDDAVKALSEFGEARGYAADVSNPASVTAMFDSAMKDFGKIDVFGQQRRHLSAVRTDGYDPRSVGYGYGRESALRVPVCPERLPLHEG